LDQGLIDVEHDQAFVAPADHLALYRHIEVMFRCDLHHGFAQHIFVGVDDEELIGHHRGAAQAPDAVDVAARFGNRCGG
jgi:hypothetical protein